MRYAALLCVLLISACGDDRRGGGTTILRRDGGGFLDAGPNGTRDAGAGVVRDAGPVDPQRDSGVTPPRDGGTLRDGGARPDAGAPMRLRVPDLQDVSRPSFPGVGAAVQLEDVVVSAVVPAGGQAGSFYVQEVGGGPYSGVFVFVPMGAVPPTVAIGDRVAVTGTLEEFFGVTEVVFSSLLARTPGAAPIPTDVVPGSIATLGSLAETYEGVLVRVQNVTVVSDNPDAPDDFGEFTVTGDLRIDDALFRLTPRPLPFSSIDYVIGVHHYAFENFKLYPRSADDIGPIF